MPRVLRMGWIMARGRMINKAIGQNREVDELIEKHGYRASQFYTWMIPHADREGRLHGNPAVLRAMVMPKRIDDFTIDLVETILSECHRLRLILWYSVRGERYIWLPGFDRNQQGLRKKREPASIIPAPSEALREQWSIDNSGSFGDGDDDDDACEPVIPVELADASTRVETGVDDDPTDSRQTADNDPTTIQHSTDNDPALSRQPSGRREGKGREKKGRKGKLASPSATPRTVAGSGEDPALRAILDCYPAADPDRALKLIDGMTAECPSVEIAFAVRSAKQWQLDKNRTSKDPIAFLRNWIRRENGTDPNKPKPNGGTVTSQPSQKNRTFEEAMAHNAEVEAASDRRYGKRGGDS